jgi:hypothetical protein
MRRLSPGYLIRVCGWHYSIWGKVPGLLGLVVWWGVILNTYSSMSSRLIMKLMIKIHSFQSDDLISTTIVLLEMLFERDIFVKDEDEKNNQSKKSLRQRKFQMQVELITVESNSIDKDWISLSVCLLNVRISVPLYSHSCSHSVEAIVSYIRDDRLIYSG